MIARSAVLALSIFWLVSCASSTPERVVSRIPDSERAYVLDPMTGYPLTLDADVRAELRTAFAGFEQGRPPEEVAAVAKARLETDPSLQPAEVLLAQVDFLAHRNEDVLVRVEPILDEWPDYVAASLLAARAQERRGAVLRAYDLFAGLAPINRTAAERADELRPRAVEIVERRFSDALDRGRVEDAATFLQKLEALGIPDLALVEHRLRYDVEVGDREAELATLGRWLELRDAGAGGGVSELIFERRRRVGELELEIGDVRSGMEIFEGLVAERSDDPSLLDEVDRARFLWRLELLPPKIKEIARASELDRAELASLLYWLFPAVRFSPVEDPPIAADILDHPNRQEVVRVLDLDLMAVDESVHRFRPMEGATREAALSALLTLLQSAEPPASCVAGLPRTAAAERRRRQVCEQATVCGLIAEPTECLPEATLSGGEAIDLVRRCLNRMSS